MKTQLTNILPLPYSMIVIQFQVIKRKKGQQRDVATLGIHEWKYLIDVGVLTVSMNILRSHSKPIRIPVTISQLIYIHKRIQYILYNYSYNTKDYTSSYRTCRPESHTIKSMG